MIAPGADTPAPIAGLVTTGHGRGYPRAMTNSSPETRVETAAMLAAAGITVTTEGKARARAKLRAARDRWTPELDAKLREQLGLPARAA